MPQSAREHFQEMQESYDLLAEWEPQSDVFAFRKMPYIAAAASSCTAAYINAHYRKVLKLRHHAFASSLLPVVALPAMVGFLMHTHYVQVPLLTQSVRCPVCLEARGGAVQLFAGFLYPLVLAPTASFHLATRMYTYPVPSIRDQPREVWRLLTKLTSKVKSQLLLLAGFQVVLGMAWTHWEAHSLFTVLTKLAAMEQDVKQYQKDMDEKRNSVF